MAHYRFERRIATGQPVAGIDEAGRGPLAGPVAAAAVILDPKNLPRGLDDSKQLDHATRERLADVIMTRAVAVSVAFASVVEIDRLNIRRATHLAMRDDPPPRGAGEDHSAENQNARHREVTGADVVWAASCAPERCPGA